MTVAPIAGHTMNQIQLKRVENKFRRFASIQPAEASAVSLSQRADQDEIIEQTWVLRVVSLGCFVYTFLFNEIIISHNWSTITKSRIIAANSKMRQGV